MFCLPLVTATLLTFGSFAVAQFPPPSSFSNVLKSPINSNITISYKSPDPGTCVTVFSSQKQFTGYINIPPQTLDPVHQNYSINTFFWFIEARQNPETAPLTIWLNGGPGSSSMIGLFQESGPCEVVQMADGSYGTQSRLWGWDRSSNIMYIDQPTQVGFSYDRLTNWTYNPWTDKYLALRDRVPQPWSLLNGTFGSTDKSQTANTTAIAAHAVWHFLQGWLSAFPQYNPGSKPNSTITNPAGIHLFAESYGGQYGPTFADFFEEQNTKRGSGILPANSTLDIKLISLGIINGLVDQLIQTQFYPQFANNNTYGIQAISTLAMLNNLSDFNGPNGCKAKILICRAEAAALDGDGEGDVDSVNQACAAAVTSCATTMSAYDDAGRSVYDIRDQLPQSFPSDAYLEYLNDATVQKSIGVPVNFTSGSSAVYSAFDETGDLIRGTQLASLSSLLARGVHVAFIYGDADYICNWVGGEAVSKAVAALQPTYATAFPAAGYAQIVVNSSYVGGAVRQFGNLSFSRIYDAGHEVPAYQPETAFTVFTRIIQGNEISTGGKINLSNFASTGPAYSTYKNSVPEQPKDMCWIRDAATCKADQIQSALNGQGVVIAGVWYKDKADYKPPASSIKAGVPGTLPSTSTSSVTGQSTSSLAATGVYTATSTPSSRSKNAGSRSNHCMRCIILTAAGIALQLLIS